MNGNAPIEERVRTELDRMRGEIGAEQHPADAVLTRARRATAVGLAGVVLTAAVVAGGSVVAWRAFGPSGSARPVVPATRAPDTPSVSSTVGGPSGLVPALLARPLALPSVGPGGTCPTTPLTTISPGKGAGFTGSAPAQRAGRVFLAYTSRHVTLAPNDRTAGGWYGLKDIWVVGPSYAGPVLIRGGRIDADGSVKLSWNGEAPMQDALQLDPNSPSLQTDPATGWRSVPMATYIRSPGCYAYQLDGIGFTEFVVFEASR